MVTLVGILPLVLPFVEMCTPYRTEQAGNTTDRIAKMNMRRERMPKTAESLIPRLGLTSANLYGVCTSLKGDIEPTAPARL
jgi:hypothetical protein